MHLFITTTSATIWGHNMGTYLLARHMVTLVLVKNKWPCCAFQVSTSAADKIVGKTQTANKCMQCHRMTLSRLAPVEITSSTIRMPAWSFISDQHRVDVWCASQLLSC